MGAKSRRRAQARHRAGSVRGAAFGLSGAAGSERPAPADPTPAVATALRCAVAALDRQDDGLDAAVDALAVLWSQDPATVDRALLSTLTDQVAQVWHRGWQPADLHRLAGRRLGAEAQALLGKAIVHELSRYAPATVDPRWSGQLSAADLEVRRPAVTDYLRERLRPGLSRHAVLTEVAAIVHLLIALPPLERLGPRPGQAPAPTAREARTEVDERILTRVRALLAKAESTTFESEAETFTAGAQALMARHSIDLALLAADTRPRGDEPGGRRIGLDNPYEAPKAMLLDAVSRANRCRTVWSRELGFSTVIGHDSDLDAVETLFTSLLLQAQSALNREGSRSDRAGRSRTRAFRSSFLTAYATRIGERLSEVTQAETDTATAEASSSGRDLVPVLAARDAAVQEKVAALFPRLTERRIGSVRDGEGWHSGRAAADRAALDVGAPLTG